MKPILYSPTETTFAHNGIGVLTDCVSCVVTEERNGAFELEMAYPVDGAFYTSIAVDAIIKAKPNETKGDQLGAPSVRKVPQGFCVLSLIIVVLNRCSQWLCRFCLQGRLVLDMLLKVFFHFFGSGFTDDSNAVVVNFYALVSLSVLVFRCRYYDFLNKFVYQLGRESFEAGNLLRFVNKLL